MRDLRQVQDIENVTAPPFSNDDNGSLKANRNEGMGALVRGQESQVVLSFSFVGLCLWASLFTGEFSHAYLITINILTTR